MTCRCVYAWDARLQCRDYDLEAFLSYLLHSKDTRSERETTLHANQLSIFFLLRPLLKIVDPDGAASSKNARARRRPIPERASVDIEARVIFFLVPSYFARS